MSITPAEVRAALARLMLATAAGQEQPGALTAETREQLARLQAAARPENIGRLIRALESLPDDEAPAPAGGAARLSADGGSGHWVQVGTVRGRDGKNHGGTPVYMRDGKILKGPAGLTGHTIEAVKGKHKSAPEKEAAAAGGKAKPGKPKAVPPAPKGPAKGVQQILGQVKAGALTYDEGLDGLRQLVAALGPDGFQRAVGKTYGQVATAMLLAAPPKPAAAKPAPPPPPAAPAPKPAPPGGGIKVKLGGGQELTLTPPYPAKVGYGGQGPPGAFVFQSQGAGQLKVPKGAPKESLEYLSHAPLAAVKALQDYTDVGYQINQNFYHGQPLTESQKKQHAAMQKAFRHARPFARPVEVERGFNLGGAELAKSLAAWKESLATGRPFTQPGYTSTGINYKFHGKRVNWRVKATKGLCVDPLSTHGENEVLLNHNSRFVVTKLEEKAGRYFLELEQVA